MKVQLVLVLAPLLALAIPISPIHNRQLDGVDQPSEESCEATFQGCKFHAGHHHPGGMTLQQCKDERSEFRILGHIMRQIQLTAFTRILHG